MKAKALIYCTKAKPYLIDYSGMATGFKRFVVCPITIPFTSDDEQPILNGKIVCECEVETEEISFQVPSSYGCYEWGEEEKCYAGARTENYDLLKKSCLTEEEIDNYLNGNGYALHISNLKIFDKPLELKDCQIAKGIVNYSNEVCDSCCDFNMNCKDCYYHYETYELKNAPMNMCWVWYKGKRYVLISIQSQWVCKELNGEKPIEVRRKVLKGMVER